MIAANACPLCGARPWSEFGIVPDDAVLMEHVCRSERRETEREAIQEWNRRTAELTASRAFWAKVAPDAAGPSITAERLITFAANILAWSECEAGFSTVPAFVLDRMVVACGLADSVESDGGAACWLKLETRAAVRAILAKKQTEANT